MSVLNSRLLEKVLSAGRNRVARNSAYNLVGFAVPLLLLLAFTPILVARLGPDAYGLWTLATSSLGLMGVFEFGLASAMTKFIAEFHGTRDLEGISATVTIGCLSYAAMGVLLTVPMYFLAGEIGGFFRASELTAPRVAGVIQMASFGLFPSMLKNGALAVPRGLQRYRVPMLFNVAQNGLVLCAAFVTVSLGGSVEAVIRGTVVVLWAVGLGALVSSLLLLRELGARFCLDRTHARSLFGYMVYMGTTGIGQRLINSMDRLTVGAVLDLSSVTYYTVAIAIAKRFVQFADAASQVLMPAASSWHAAGDRARVWKYLRRSTLIIAAINLSVALVLLAVSAPLLRLWMGQEFASHALGLFRVLLVVYAVVSVSAPAFHIANGIGAAWVTAACTLASGVTTIAAIVGLSKQFSLMGAAWGNAGYFLNLAVLAYAASVLRPRVTGPTAPSRGLP